MLPTKACPAAARRGSPAPITAPPIASAARSISATCSDRSRACSREIDHAAPLARNLASENARVAERPPIKARFNRRRLSRLPGRPTARPARRARAAGTGRTSAHPRTIVDNSPCYAVDGRAVSASPPWRAAVPSALRDRSRSSAAGRTARAPKARAPSARATRPRRVGRERCTSCTVARSFR